MQVWLQLAMGVLWGTNFDPVKQGCVLVLQMDAIAKNDVMQKTEKALNNTHTKTQ